MMENQLSLEEAKRLSIIKWEAHIKAGGFEPNIFSVNELSYLKNGCGFCERWKTEIDYGCPTCEFMQVAGRCGDHSSLHEIWVDSDGDEELANAIKILEVINSL